MMGRGLVEPLDMWHEENPPSHPDVLKLLAAELHDHGYDLRYLLRELALSATYQQSSERVASAETSVSVLKPLTPEQLAWSMMQATGLVEQSRQGFLAKQAKAKKPEDRALVEDSQWCEAQLNAALQKHVDAFVSTFGVQGIQTSQFDASADQALFLRNGSLIQSWLEPQPQRLTARVADMPDADAVRELYLAVFSRRPNDQEQHELETYLQNAKDHRADAVRQIVWAMLTSAEFRFNH